MGKPSRQQDDLRVQAPKPGHHDKKTRSASRVGTGFTALDPDPGWGFSKGVKSEENSRAPSQLATTFALPGPTAVCSATSALHETVCRTHPPPPPEQPAVGHRQAQTRAGGGLVLRPFTASLLPTSTSEDRCRNNLNRLSSVAKAKITWSPLPRSIKKRKLRRDRIPMIPRLPPAALHPFPQGTCDLEQLREGTGKVRSPTCACSVQAPFLKCTQPQLVETGPQFTHVLAPQRFSDANNQRHGNPEEPTYIFLGGGGATSVSICNREGHSESRILNKGY